MTLAEQSASPPEAPPDPPRPKRMWLALFNDAGGLIGFDETTADKIPPGGVAFPDPKPDNACDGRYRWNDNEKRFDPIPVRLLEVGDTAAFNNMVLGVLAGFVDEKSVPVEIMDSVEFIRRTGAGDAAQLQRLVQVEGQRLLKRFKARGKAASRRGG
jgi:hypothetical protein